jgi:phage replication-related protein YjqB (UPF0714/DUF867 family)
MLLTAEGRAARVDGRYRLHVALADLLAHPDVVEQQVLAPAAPGMAIGFLALHGGLEPGTAEIAVAAARRAGSSWYVIVQPDDLKCHVPSHEHDPAEAPLLAGFLDHVDVVISVHGYWGHDDLRDALLVGGCDRVLATALARRLRAALPDYRVVDDLAAIPRRLRGVDPRNPVNRAPRGVQVELPHPVRAIGPYGRGEAGARHRAHTDALVDALAAFADEEGTR